MAKGLRASVKKGNRSKLRANVFGPVEAARAERLHAKLLETVNQPKPEPPKKSDMDVDSAEDGNAQQTTQEGGFPKDMEVDGAATSSSKPKRKDDRKSKRKVRGRKPRNQISFPTSRGKGALKPFSDGRIRKAKRS